MSKSLIKKFLIFLILVLLLVISLSLINDDAVIQQEDISVDGTIVCLPHKETQSTTECALGIRTFNKDQYSLQFMHDPDDLSFDQVYRITGIFIPDKNGTSEYDELGTITVKVIEKLTS